MLLYRRRGCIGDLQARGLRGKSTGLTDAIWGSKLRALSNAYTPDGKDVGAPVTNFTGSRRVPGHPCANILTL